LQFISRGLVRKAGKATVLTVWAPAEVTPEW
jgi:hypothetical protein